jgi:hypothetical protein
MIFAGFSLNAFPFWLDSRRIVPSHRMTGERMPPIAYEQTFGLKTTGRKSSLAAQLAKLYADRHNKPRFRLAFDFVRVAERHEAKGSQ